MNNYDTSVVSICGPHAIGVSVSKGYFCLFAFWLCYVACRNLVSYQELNWGPWAVKAPSLNHLDCQRILYFLIFKKSWLSYTLHHSQTWTYFFFFLISIIDILLSLMSSQRFLTIPNIKQSRLCKKSLLITGDTDLHLNMVIAIDCGYR